MFPVSPLYTYANGIFVGDESFIINIHFLKERVNVFFQFNEFFELCYFV